MGTPANIAATFEELPSVTPSTTSADTPKTSTDTPDAKVDFATADSSVAKSNGEKDTKFTDPDASATLASLRDLGITPANAKEFVDAQRTLQNVAYALQHSPADILNELRQNNPEAFEKFIDVASDMYLERHPVKADGTADAGRGGASESVRQNDPLMKEVQALKQELGEMKSVAQQRAANDRLGELKKEYTGKVNKMLARVPGLSARDRRALVALTSESLSEDTSAVARVNGGDFRDVSKHLQRVYDSWSADTKTASSEEHAARETVKANGDRVIPTSAGTEAGGAASTDKADGTRASQRDAWESSELEFAKALNKTRK